MRENTSLHADMSLFDISEEETEVIRAPEISKLLTTPDTLNTLLYSRALRLLSFPTLKDYIFRYCLHALRKSLPEQEGYKNYQVYIDLIYSRVCSYLLHHPQKILIGKRISNHASSALLAWLYWSKKSPWDKKKICRHILVTQSLDPSNRVDPSNRDFIDLRFFQSVTDLEEEQSGVDYDEDPYTTSSFFAPNRFFLQQDVTLHFSHHNLTLEELALICAGHIIEQESHKRNKYGSFTDILPEIDTLVEKRRAYKEQRNTARLKRIADGASLAVLLKRIRKGDVVPLSVLRKKAGAKRKRLNNAEFTAMVYNAFLGSLFDAGELQKLSEAPTARQLLQLKTGLIMALNRGRSHISSHQFQELFKNEYLPPFLLDSSKLFTDLSKKIKSQLMLSEKELIVLTAKTSTKLKRLGKINPNDRAAMQHIATLRAKHNLLLLPTLYLAIWKCRRLYRQNFPTVSHGL